MHSFDVRWAEVAQCYAQYQHYQEPVGPGTIVADQPATILNEQPGPVVALLALTCMPRYTVPLPIAKLKTAAKFAFSASSKVCSCCMCVKRSPARVMHILLLTRKEAHTKWQDLPPKQLMLPRLLGGCQLLCCELKDLKHSAFHDNSEGSS